VLGAQPDPAHAAVEALPAVEGPSPGDVVYFEGLTSPAQAEEELEGGASGEEQGAHGRQQRVGERCSRHRVTTGSRPRPVPTRWGSGGWSDTGCLHLGGAARVEARCIDQGESTGVR
jgi:hypothetical protein